LADKSLPGNLRRRDPTYGRASIDIGACRQGPPVRPLDGVVVEMSVSGKNYVDPEGWKLIQEPLWVKACWIIPPRIGENRQTGRRCDLECIVSIELDLDIA
jgi:hypothetical protein